MEALETQFHAFETWLETNTRFWAMFFTICCALVLAFLWSDSPETFPPLFFCIMERVLMVCFVVVIAARFAAVRVYH
jgi:hypothetical protein